jgi:hypothetical protein
MDVNLEKGPDLLLIPPDTEVSAEFDVEGVTDYSITFLDDSSSIKYALVRCQINPVCRRKARRREPAGCLIYALRGPIAAE